MKFDYKPIGFDAMVFSGYAFKSNDFCALGIPVIRIGNLQNRNVDFSNTQFFPNYKVTEKHNKFFLNDKDILIAMTGQGSVGRVAQIRIENNKKVLLNQRVGKFIVGEKKLHRDFLFYIISSPVYQQLLFDTGNGSGQPNLSPKDILNVEIPYPNYDEQRAIAATLSALDDKIALNNRVNRNLEQMAQAIFKSWFVDFEPWGGVIPEGWREGTLSEIANITMGQSPNGSSYNEDGIGTVFYQGRAEFGSRFPTRRLFTTEPKRMAAKGDALMSVRAPVGDLNIAFEACCVGRGLAAIQSNCGCQSFVFYNMVTLKQHLDMFNGEGTVFGSINKNDMAKLPVLIPSCDVIHQFEELVKPLDKIVEANYAASCNLQAIRDALLPKLISGEIGCF